MVKIPELNFPTIAKKRSFKTNSLKKYKKIKEHRKDIDFRTRKQRYLEWEKDIKYWLEDLEKHDNEFSRIQLPLLHSIYEGLLTDTKATVEWIKVLSTENDYPTRYLALSLKWLLMIE